MALACSSTLAIIISLDPHLVEHSSYEVVLREFEIPLGLRQRCLLLQGKVPHQLPAHGRGNKGNNRSFCDTSMTFGTVMAKGIPKRCGFGAIVNLQYGAHGSNFSKWPPVTTVFLSGMDI